MSRRFKIFLGFRIHNCSGLPSIRYDYSVNKLIDVSLIDGEKTRKRNYLMQFQRTQGNHMATPNSTTRKTTSKMLRLSSGTFFFQNSPRISERRKHTVMISMSACETKPSRDWCSWAVSIDCRKTGRLWPIICNNSHRHTHGLGNAVANVDKRRNAAKAKRKRFDK